MNSIEDVYKTINALIKSDVKPFHIEKETGLSRSKIGRLKKGENSLDNLSLSSAKILYEYAIAHLNE
ncbi:hypothetical protein [Mammaliicoccus lentus]|uniref:hypothetical protein n=1 Tax=Mammaliicoccus lentus TaxID=42858 RepID=UPI002DBBA2E1|nr:hypothetical protein [Mammaliicoccus lentus]MEB8091823.1 hypothetical protein [Mammaliicoccus lentus]